MSFAFLQALKNVVADYLLALTRVVDYLPALREVAELLIEPLSVLREAVGIAELLSVLREVAGIVEPLSVLKEVAELAEGLFSPGGATGFAGPWSMSREHL